MKTTSIAKPNKQPLSLKTEEAAKANFRKFILDDNHPCVMAQTVFSMDQVEFHEYDNLGSKSAAKKILKDLNQYISAYDFESRDFFTFIASFRGRKDFTEKQFEQLLWKQLQFLHEEDDKAWDPEVESDPAHNKFSFSLGGKAFYIVGLHPNSSRKARQSPAPALVFNLHWQFEKLREMGTYEVVRDKIRERDIELQGTMNPMLDNFGNSSEARQYSGRKVGEEWKCPFLSGKI